MWQNRNNPSLHARAASRICSRPLFYRVIIILFDMHSHILPGVDDGAEDMSESLAILKIMREQGITHVAATPHFYAASDNLELYLQRVSEAYNRLKAEAAESGLPKIYLGSEVLYYRGIGKSEAVFKLCINSSPFLLLELSDNCIGNGLFEDLTDLRREMGIKPIIAHIERYFKFPKYRKLLSFISENGIPAQINASSLFNPVLCPITVKLIKKNLVSFMGTDSHSVSGRPPLIKPALEVVAEKNGPKYANGFIRNSQKLLELIG